MSRAAARVALLQAAVPPNERSIVGQAIASVLAIYDPTLDVHATPAFLSDEDVAGFESDPDDLIDHHAIRGRDPVSDGYKLQDLRPTLDGRPVRGAFEASRSGGWVRFLVMRQNDDGTMTAYSNRKRQHPPGTVVVSGAVTGIAFGEVAWLVRKRDVEVPDASESDGEEWKTR